MVIWLMGQRAGYSTYYRMREIGKGRTKYFETRMLFFWCWPPPPPSLRLIDRTIRSFYRVFQKQVHSITMMYTYITLLHSEREIRRKWCNILVLYIFGNSMRHALYARRSRQAKAQGFDLERLLIYIPLYPQLLLYHC